MRYHYPMGVNPADYDLLLAEVGDAIVEVAQRRTLTAPMVADRFGWTPQAATAVLRRLVKQGRLQARRHTKVSWRSGASLSGYSTSPIDYHAPRPTPDV